MTPKEKAWELWNYYGTETGKYNIAGKLGIKVVEELLEFMERDDKKNDCCYFANSPIWGYWEDVKVELNKLS